MRDWGSSRSLPFLDLIKGRWKRVVQRRQRPLPLEKYGKVRTFLGLVPDIEPTMVGRRKKFYTCFVLSSVWDFKQDSWPVMKENQGKKRLPRSLYGNTLPGGRNYQQLSLPPTSPLCTPVLPSSILSLEVLFREYEMSSQLNNFITNNIF